MKKKLIGMFCIATMCGAMLSGCGTQTNDASNTTIGTNEQSTENSTENEKLSVVTTIFAPYDFTKQIVGEEADVTMLLSPGAETHSYEPTPQDIIKIQNCDVFIYVGGENDEWVDGILESIDNNKMQVIKLLDCVDAVEEEVKEGMEAEEEEEEATTEEEGEEIEWDEHVWTSPKNAILISEAIEKVCSEMDEENASIYQENLDTYVQKLNELDEAFEEVVNNAVRKTVVFGDRFPLRYFVEAYGLDYFAAFPGCSSDTEVSAATMAYLIDKVEAEEIPVVFQIELSNGNIATTIAEATGAKVLTFYSCHNVSKDDFEAGVTYLDMMWKNVDSLKEALN